MNTGFMAELLSDVVVLCHGDPVALDVQNQHLHVHQQSIDREDVVWVNTSPGSSPGCNLNWSSHQISSTQTNKATSSALCR